MTARTIAEPSECLTAEDSNLDTLRSIDLVKGPVPGVVVPFDSFKLADQDAEQRCLIYDELLGPDMAYMTEIGGPENYLFPASMIRKIAAQTLRGLSVLHARGITCGTTPSPTLSGCVTHAF